MGRAHTRPRGGRALGKQSLGETGHRAGRGRDEREDLQPPRLPLPGLTGQTAEPGAPRSPFPPVSIGRLWERASPQPLQAPQNRKAGEPSLVARRPLESPLLDPDAPALNTSLTVLLMNLNTWVSLRSVPALPPPPLLSGSGPTRHLVCGAQARTRPLRVPGRAAPMVTSPPGVGGCPLPPKASSSLHMRKPRPREMSRGAAPRPGGSAGGQAGRRAPRVRGGDRRGRGSAKQGEQRKGPWRGCQVFKAPAAQGGSGESRPRAGWVRAQGCEGAARTRRPRGGTTLSRREGREYPGRRRGWG